MTQEDKELLLKDLSSRLLYNCRVFYEYIDNLDNKTYGYSLTLNTWCIDEFIANKAVIKPYLRPMSSMTEEEEEEYWDIINSKSPEIPVGEIPSIETIAQCSVIVLDWLLSKEFDIKGLIPMGLAIAVTEENNPYKK